MIVKIISEQRVRITEITSAFKEIVKTFIYERENYHIGKFLRSYRIVGAALGRLKSYKGILQSYAYERRKAAAARAYACGDADAPRLALHGGRRLGYYGARRVEGDAVEAGLVSAHVGCVLRGCVGALGDGQ